MGPARARQGSTGRQGVPGLCLGCACLGCLAGAWRVARGDPPTDVMFPLCPAGTPRPAPPCALLLERSLMGPGGVLAGERQPRPAPLRRAWQGLAGPWGRDAKSLAHNSSSMSPQAAQAGPNLAGTRWMAPRAVGPPLRQVGFKPTARSWRGSGKAKQVVQCSACGHEFKHQLVSNPSRHQTKHQSDCFRKKKEPRKTP